MTTVHKNELKCPACGEESDITISSYVNVNYGNLQKQILNFVASFVKKSFI